jgi:hypothetical protein
MQPVAYDFRAVIIAPETFAALSADIAQAIGPSARDDLSFESISATKSGVQYQVCDVAITAETHAGYLAMQTNPAILHGAVLQGWERKDMDGTPPTMTECAAWLDESTIWLGPAWALSGVSIGDVLASLGYALVVPEPTAGVSP